MKQRQLGRTDLAVSAATLGTMTFGAREWGCPPDTAHEILDSFAAAGGTCIDTANNYADGAAERIVGDWLKRQQRDAFIISTKCYFRQSDAPTVIGLSRKNVIAAVEASLRRLQTDYIDIQYLHAPDPRTPHEETMQALDDLIRSGKVRYGACSNFMAWQLVATNAAARQLGAHQLSCGQYLYNLIDRECEREVLPACAHEGMGFVVWSPLAGGLLTGKYGNCTKPPPGSRAEHRRKLDGERFWHKRGLRIAAGLQQLSQRAATTAATLALQWIAGQPRVASLVLGVRSTGQLEQNLAALREPLAPELRSALDELSRPTPTQLEQFAQHAGELLPPAAAE